MIAPDEFIFYLGTHKPDWLSRAGVPLFVSRHALARVKRKLPVAAARWALDSGGFTELSKNGAWTVSPETYAAEVREWSSRIGNLDFAMIQDSMCEPAILEKTKSTIVEHQKRTIENYFRLRDLAPEINWAPVIQGWERDDYYAHVDRYEAAGVDLRSFDRVGVGSVCRRQATAMAEDLVADLRAYGINIHALGFKLAGLANTWRNLASSDSLAWSLNARLKEKRLALCTHKNCGNCIAFALDYRLRILREVCGTYEACPECGSDDVAPPHDGSFACVDCGHSWDYFVAHNVTAGRAA
jgi:hypothetical protein